MTAPISFAGVGRRFGGAWALTDIDLDLSRGVIGLLGPNGAGKTTLLRLLATALAPTRGEISVFGLDPAIPDQRTGIRRRLGYLPQELGFPRGFSAFAFVDYVAVLKEWNDTAPRHAEVRRVLDLVNLAGVATKRIRTLSGGQRRRLALAQALLGAPELLALDEPTAGLDPEQRASLRTVLAEAARTSVVMLSTHQTEDVAALCERVIVLAGGRVRYDGPVRDLVRHAAGRVWLADDADPAAPGVLAHRNWAVPQHRPPRSGRSRTRRTVAGGRLPAPARRWRWTDTEARGSRRMTATLIRPVTLGTLATLTWYETRRYVRSPVLLVAFALTAYAIYDLTRGIVADADELPTYPAAFIGGFGMIAACWLTQSMRPNLDPRDPLLFQESR